MPRKKKAVTIEAGEPVKAPADKPADPVKTPPRPQDTVKNPIADKCGDCRLRFKGPRCPRCVIYKEFYLPIKDQQQAEAIEAEKRIKAQREVEAEKAKMKNLLKD